MFSKITETFQRFDTEQQQKLAEFEREKQHNLDYYSVQTATSKNCALADAYNAQRLAAIAAATDEINAVVEAAQDSINAYIATPVPADLANTLTALREIKQPTAAELDALINAHKGNYIATRAILDACGGAAAGCKVVTYEGISSKVSRFKATALAAINSDRDGYNFMTMRNGAAAQQIGAEVAAFLGTVPAED